MKKCLVSCLIAGMAIFGVQAASLEICRLRCEDSENPVGVVCAQPRLTWTLRGDEPAERPAFARRTCHRYSTPLSSAGHV